MNVRTLQRLPKFRTSTLFQAGALPAATRHYPIPVTGRHKMSSSAADHPIDSTIKDPIQKSSVVEDGEYMKYVKEQEKAAEGGSPTRLPPVWDDGTEIDWEEWSKALLKDTINTLESSHMKPGAPWGFVVYRAVYGPETDVLWKRMLDEIKSEIYLMPENLKKPEKLLPYYELTVVEDEKRFSGADSHTIRRAFREWAADDLPPRLTDPDSRGGIEKVRDLILNHDRVTIGVGGEPSHPWYWAPPRWNFCLFVDEKCLRSFQNGPMWRPVVKIVNMQYSGERCESIAEDWEDGETDDHEEDVGWMYISAESYVKWYDLFVDPNNWYDNAYYRRPEKEDFPTSMDDWGPA